MPFIPGNRCAHPWACGFVVHSRLSMLHAMIMAGGGGTRFWPRSRQKRPKQFLTLVGDRTLLQQAIGRVEGAAADERTWVITAAMHREEAARQLASVPMD